MASPATYVTTVRLDSIVRFVGGGTPSKSRPEFFAGDIPWVSPKDMKSSELWDAADHITQGAVEASTTSLIPVNSVLAVVRSGVLKHSLPLAINRVPVAINQDIKALVCTAQVSPEYLFHFLRYSAPQILQAVRGTTADNIPVDGLKALQVPLPPLSEQRRSAAILDQADALRAKRNESIRKTALILPSLFREMFGGTDSWGSGRWPLRPLGEITSRITDGEHLNPVFSGTGMPIVMAGNVLGIGIDFAKAKYVSSQDGLKFRKKCSPERGDLLLVSRGATIGRLCEVSTDTEFCLMGSVILIKPDDGLIDSKFLETYLKLPVASMGLYHTSGSSAQQAIYIKDLRNVKCPVPPLSLQKNFAYVATKIGALAHPLSESLTKLDALFASLQHRAFRGEL